MSNILESNVEIKPSPTAGNGMFATKDIPAGELVVMIKRPLIGVLDLPRFEDTCANCFMWSVGSVEGGLTPHKPTVSACIGCKEVKYCSKKCQSESWKRDHKRMCKQLKMLPATPSHVRAARSMHIALTSDIVSDETKRAVLRMEGHADTNMLASKAQAEVDDAIERCANNSMTAVRDQYKDKGPGGVTDDLVSHEYLGKVFRNSLTLITPTFDPIGIALDPLICSANHSCDPNATVVMDGPLISFRALKPISKDSEIFISYIDNTDPYHHRRGELLERYSFTCTCSKCALGPTQREDAWLRPPSALPTEFHNLGDGPTEDSNFVHIPKYYSGDSSKAGKRLTTIQGIAFQVLETARSRTDPAAAVKDIEFVMATCKRSNMFAITRQPYAAARNELFANLLEVGNPGIALMQMCKTYFSIDPVLYPQPWHPVRVVHTWGLVKVLLWLYERPDHKATRDCHRTGLDFPVVIWRLLKEVKGLVGRSHGIGRFMALVEGTAHQVRTEIGERNLEILERDPGNIWGLFEKWKDGLKY